MRTTVRRGLLALTTTSGILLLAVVGAGPATADDGLGGTAGSSGIPLWAPALAVAGWLVIGWYLMRRNRSR